MTASGRKMTALECSLRTAAGSSRARMKKLSKDRSRAAGELVKAIKACDEIKAARMKRVCEDNQLKLDSAFLDLRVYRRLLERLEEALKKGELR